MALRWNAGCEVSMFQEADLLPLSALQHLLFCPRQAALIHVEQVWAENRLTVEGTRLHRRADESTDELRGNVRIVRGMAIRSLQHGLIGKTDVVEFAPTNDRRAAKPGKTPLKALFSVIREEPLAWRVTPVEYKRGRPKKDDSDRVQLCAQAVCLEEMLGIAVPEGALYYGQRRRRLNVEFDPLLRHKTMQAAEQCHEVFRARITPAAVFEKKCERCSLISLCLPKLASRSPASRFLKRQFAAAISGDAPETDADPPEELE